MATALDAAVGVPDDYEYELTPTEEQQFFYLVFDIEKAVRRIKYVREHLRVRHDHGTRGNVRRKDSGVEEWKISSNKRRDFRAAGRQITGWL